MPALLLCLVTSLPGQGKDEFDAVVIKPASKDLPLITQFNINPGYFRARSASLRFLVREAFGISDQQLFGGSGWMESEHYMIEAAAGSAVNKADMMLMLRNLLTTRFKLAYHREPRDFDVFALVVDKSGLKMKTLDGPMDLNAESKAPRDAIILPIGSTMEELVRWLNTRTGPANVGRLVIDRTGLHGFYRLKLMAEVEPRNDGSGGGFVNIDYASELPRQLGLRLQPMRTKVDTIVIDSAAKPNIDN